MVKVFFAAVLFLLSTSVFGQIVPVPKPSPTPPPSLETILDRAEAESRVYRETFKDLLANEDKTFEIYDKKGEVKKRRTVTSNFVVYQLQKRAGRIAEYRNVLAVDGRTLDKASLRAQDFFEKIAVAESSAGELSELEKESLRYDEELFINGLTLFQALALAPNLRPLFEFTLDGKQIVDGAEVYAISYRQTRNSPDITINSKENKPDNRITLNFEVETDRDTPLNERMRGKFLIDTATFRLWREEREITIQPHDFPAPLVVVREDFDFQRSDFGLLVPKKIVHAHYRAKLRERLAVKEAQVTFEYSKFTKPGVEVKSAEVK
jgi:hypothetical protein